MSKISYQLSMNLKTIVVKMFTKIPISVVVNINAITAFASLPTDKLTSFINFSIKKPPLREVLRKD